MAVAWRRALAVLLWVHSLAAKPVDSSPPEGYEDDLLCPPGRCRQPEQLQKEQQQQHRLKQVCSSGGMEDGETHIVPKGLGEKLSQSAWKELTEAGWHNLTCLEVLHGNCPYASGSAEWAVCRVTSNFLLSTLGELNAGKEKPVMKVRGLLVPYLGGPGAKIPDDEEHEATLEQRLDALWQQVDNATATTYVALDLDSSALANALLNDLKQDGVGNLQPAKDQSGKPVRPGLTMQQILFTILGANNWKSRFAVSGGGWSIYAWHLAIGLAIALLAILMVGVALWRAGSPKARVPD